MSDKRDELLTEVLLTEVQAAERLNLRPQTLSVWRSAKRYDLPYVKCGRLVRYRASDIQAFLTRNAVGAVPTVA